MVREGHIFHSHCTGRSTSGKGGPNWLGRTSFVREGDICQGAILVQQGHIGQGGSRRVILVREGHIGQGGPYLSGRDSLVRDGIQVDMAVDIYM